MKQFMALALLAVAVAAHPDAVRFVDAPLTADNVADMRPLIVSPEFMRKAAEIAKKVYQALEVEVDTVNIVDFADEVAPVESEKLVEDFSDSVVVAEAADEDINAEIAADAVQIVDAVETNDAAPEAVVEAEQDAAVEAQDAVVFVDVAEDVASDDSEVMKSEDVAKVDAIKFVDAPEAQVLVMPEPQLFQRYPGKQYANPILRGARL